MCFSFLIVSADEKWVEIELLGTKEDLDEERKDPHKLRPRGELRKLKELADLVEGKGR